MVQDGVAWSDAMDVLKAHNVSCWDSPHTIEENPGFKAVICQAPGGQPVAIKRVAFLSRSQVGFLSRKFSIPVVEFWRSGVCN